MVLSMVSEPWWPNGYGFESYYPYLFDKKIKYKVMWVCVNLKSKKLLLEGVLY
jgi:hypothetical protein